MFGVAFSQADQEVADDLRLDLVEGVNAPLAQMLLIAAQVAPIRTERVGGQTSLYGQMI